MGEPVLPAAACIGMTAHAWKLEVEEGKVSVTTERCGDECRYGTEYDPLYDDYEWLQMPAIPVTLAMATDCPAYDVDDNNVPTGPARPMGGYESGSHYIAHGTRCDCNWWPVAVPIEEGER